MSGAGPPDPGDGSRPGGTGGWDDDQVSAALEAAGAGLAERTGPDPTFERTLRARLVAVAAVRTARPAPRRLGRLGGGRDPAAPARRRLAVLVAGVAVLALLGVALTVGTSRALPGSPLYGAKRTVESLQLRSKDGPLDEGIARLHLAEERLREVRALADGKRYVSAGPAGTAVAGGLAASSTDRVRTTLAAMDAQTRAGSRLVEQAARATGDATPLTVLLAWAGVQTSNVQAAAATLPGDARQRAQDSLRVLADLTSTATALEAPGCLAPGASCPGTGPR